MSDFNRVILLGRIGNDPELKTSTQGKPYLRLSLATHSYKGGDQKATHWHRVMVFGTQAQVCATYLKKGSQIMVEGALEVRSYTNKEGKKSTSVSVLANQVKFLPAGRASVIDKDLDAGLETTEGMDSISEVTEQAEITAAA